jgi:hypothetical protein
MSMSQVWQAHFKFPEVRFDAKTALDISGCKLTLAPVDAHSSEGSLLFTVQADTIDAERAKATAQEWIYRNLVDPCLVFPGIKLRPEVSTPILVNESELEMLPRTGHVGMGIGICICLPLATTEVEKPLALRKKLDLHPQKRSLERSLRWFKKANDSDDDVDMFVTLWVAFNSFYSIFADKKGDKTAINTLLNSHPDADRIKEIIATHRTIIEALASKKLTDWHETTDYSEQLRASLGGQDVRSTLQKVGLCLWVVRNEVFHGGTTPNQDLGFLRGCSELLKRIYRECFCSYLDLK